MKDLNRRKNVIPPHAESAYNLGKVGECRKNIKRLETEKDEKEELSEKLEQEKTEERSFKEQLEQAMRDLGIFQDEQTPAIAVWDQAISSRNSAIATGSMKPCDTTAFGFKSLSIKIMNLKKKSTPKAPILIRKNKEKEASNEQRKVKMHCSKLMSH